jgi:hypothetical protein
MKRPHIVIGGAIDTEVHIACCNHHREADALRCAGNANSDPDYAWLPCGAMDHGGYWIVARAIEPARST